MGRVIPKKDTEQEKKPGLYVISTPIGNLQDLSLRAIKILKQCELILAEDTRLTNKLFKSLNISKKKYQILNIDINIILEKPHLNTHILNMRKNLSKLIKTNIENISIKATTADKLGFIGSQKGIMSTSTILLIKNK